MTIWNEFSGYDAVSKDRRLLLITQRTGTADALDMDIPDVVVGQWTKYLWGFAIANGPNETPSGGKLNVRYWAELPELPLVTLRGLDGMQTVTPNP
jgi:hypothetical protein